MNIVIREKFRISKSKTYLSQDYWFLSFWLSVLIKLAESLFDVLRNILIGNSMGISTDYLCQINSFLFHQLFGSMKFVPKLFFNFVHVGPGVHLVGLNIINFLLSFILLGGVTFVIFDYVGFFWILDDNLGNFLWGLDFIDFHLILEPPLNDLGNGHVVNFLLGIQLSLTDCPETT